MSPTFPYAWSRARKCMPYKVEAMSMIQAYKVSQSEHSIQLTTDRPYFPIYAQNYAIHTQTADYENVSLKKKEFKRIHKYYIN